MNYYQQLKETKGEKAAKEYMRRIGAHSNKYSHFADPEKAREAQIKSVEVKNVKNQILPS